MWLIHLLPLAFISVIIHGIVAVGLILFLISFFAKFLPGFGMYALPVRIASCAVILAGVYFEGVVNTHLWYQEQVKELQAQLDGLKAAQPPGAQPTATTERKPRPVEVTKDPHQWGRERARNMRAAMSEAVPAQFSNPPARQF